MYSKAPQNASLAPIDSHAENPISGALYMATVHGTPVFPLRPGTKLPYADEGIRVATDDMLQILAWARERPGCNFGVATAGLAVIDVDIKHGGRGFETLDALCTANGGLPNTLQIASPSGGQHLFFRAEGIGQVCLGDAVDVRGMGGYVVCRGSVVDGKSYRAMVEAPIAEIPERWRPLFSRPRQRKENDRRDIPAVELDTPEATSRATAYLESRAGVLEGGRNNAGFAIACHLRDLGLSQDTAAEMLANAWGDRCSPQLDAEECQEIARNAYRYAHNVAGGRHSNADFGDVLDKGDIDVFEKTAPAAAKAPIFTTASGWIGKTPEPKPFLVPALVPLGAVTVLVSAGGRGKTLLAQQLMTCVAAGKPFLGLPVIRGHAAGLFCEDDEQILQGRQTSICSGYGVELPDFAERLHIAARPDKDTMLWDRNGETDLFKRMVGELTRSGELKLLVVDGAAITFGGSENDRQEVTAFVRMLGRLAARRQIAILLLVHESKSSRDNDTHAASGSTAWLNSSRSTIKLNNFEPRTEAERDAIKSGAMPRADRVLSHIKTNWGQAARPIFLKFDCNSILTNASHDGARETACLDLTAGLIRKAIAAGERLSPANRASNYAGKWLMSNQGVARFELAEFERALSALLDDETEIAIEEYTEKGKTRKHIVVSRDQFNFTEDNAAG